MNILILIFLLLPVVVFSLIGFNERKRINSFATFFQHGTKISKFNFFATLTSSTAGLAATILLIAVYGYLYGIGVFFWLVIFWWLTQWASVRTIEKVEKMHPGFWKNRGTLHEFFGLVFKSQSVRATAAILSIVCFTILLVAEVILSYRLVFTAFEGGNGSVITSFPISKIPIIIHVVILITIFYYISAAGFRAVIRTDFIQFSIVGLMVLVLTGYLGRLLPDMMGMHKEVFGSTVIQRIINPVAIDPLLPATMPSRRTNSL